MKTVRLSEFPKGYRPVMAWGDMSNDDLPDGFFFILVPDRTQADWKGHWWHRDIAPAITRFASALTGRPAYKGNRHTLHPEPDILVRGLEGYEDEEGMLFFNNRLACKNQRVWGIYERETKEFAQVEFVQ